MLALRKNQYLMQFQGLLLMESIYQMEEMFIQEMLMYHGELSSKESTKL